MHAVHPLDDPYKVKYTKRDRHDKIALVPNTSHAFCRLMTAAMRNRGVRAEALDIGREDAIRRANAMCTTTSASPRKS